MADKQPPKKRTPLVGKGDRTPGRKVGREGTPQNPKIKRDSKGNKLAEIIEPQFDPKNPAD